MRILGFGEAPKATALGYSVLFEMFDGTLYQAESEYADEDVILVQGAACADEPEVFEFAVFSKPA